MEKLAPALFIAASFKFEETDHPNEMPFEGTLLLTDVPSDMAPHGSKGKKILVPREVAARRLRTIEGMGINYSETLDGHNVRKKVGVVKKSWLEGNAVKVSGVIWKKDFPETKRDIKGRPGLGMSMEADNVQVEDIHASVWKLTDLTFTGATVLKAHKAAYHDTTLAASAVKGTGGLNVSDKKKKAAPKKPDAQKSQEINASGLAKVLSNLVAATTKQTEVLTKMGTDIAELKASAAKTKKEADPEEELLKQIMGEGEEKEEEAKEEVEASGDEDDAEDEEELEASSDEEAEGEEIEAGCDDDDEEDDDDDDDEDEMEAAAEDVKKPAKVKKPSNLLAAAVGTIKSLRAQVGKLSKANTVLSKKYRKLEAQADKFAEHIDRRTLPAETVALLEKGGYDPKELLASGNKLTVASVDTMLSEIAKQGIQLSNVDRMTFKNVLLQKGMMEDGRIDRGYSM